MSRWKKCPGSVRLSAGIESKSSSYAEEGSAAHALAELCLVRGATPRTYLNWWVGRNAVGSHFLVQDKPEPHAAVFAHQVTEEMAEAVSGLFVHGPREAFRREELLDEAVEALARYVER